MEKTDLDIINEVSWVEDRKHFWEIKPHSIQKADNQKATLNSMTARLLDCTYGMQLKST